MSFSSLLENIPILFKNAWNEEINHIKTEYLDRITTVEEKLSDLESRLLSLEKILNDKTRSCHNDENVLLINSSVYLFVYFRITQMLRATLKKEIDQKHLQDFGTLDSHKILNKKNIRLF